MTTGSNKSRTPDFLVIGAQKCASTSLFQYLKSHPDIYMPLQKETEFFYRDDQFEKGFDWYCSHYFDSVSESIVGEASPQYMCSDRVPARIARHLPDVKLIAIVRNPIDRAYSHYQMSRRRGQCDSGFLETLEMSRDRSGQPYRAELAPSDTFRFGEYGTILSRFANYFPADQLKVVFLEELQQSPASTMSQIYGWLGVDDRFVSESLDTIYHQGGSKRFPRLERVLKSSKRLKGAARRILGARIYNGLYYWFETELNVRSGDIPEPLDAGMRERARCTFREDVARLEELLGRDVPWSEFRALNHEEETPDA